MAEALTTRRAVIFARELSLFNIIVEGDCLHVIQALKCSGPCPLLFGHIIDETKRLGRVLRSCMFQHVRRDVNRLAHSLVKKVVLSTNLEIWIEDLPEDVDVVFQSDLPWVWFFVLLCSSFFSLIIFHLPSSQKNIKESNNIGTHKKKKLKKNPIIYESCLQKLYSRGAWQVKSRLFGIVIWAKYINILSDTNERYIYMKKKLLLYETVSWDIPIYA